MSSSDIRDILSLDKNFKLTTPQTPKTPQTKRGRKKKTPGVSRELMALTNGKPSIVPTSPAAFAKKRKITTGTTTKWVWHEFENSARTDGLKLKRWMREEDIGEDYPFAQLNKQVKAFQYTNEEYDKILARLDHTWTKEHTNELFELCRYFDLRWPVIKDRFSLKEKTIEELKHRYYTCARQLLIARAKSDMNAIKDHPLMRNPYDIEREKKRKEYLEHLYSRDQKSIEREEELKAKLKKIEAIKKKRAEEERRELQRRKKKEREEQLKREEELANRPPETELVIKLDGSTKNPLYMTPAAQNKDYKPEPGPYARSNLMFSQLQNEKQTRRVDMILEELQVGARPMPTQKVHEQYEELQRKVMHIIQLQKNVSRKEYGLQLLKGKKEELLRKMGIKVEGTSQKGLKSTTKKRPKSSGATSQPQKKKRK